MLNGYGVFASSTSRIGKMGACLKERMKMVNGEKGW